MRLLDLPADVHENIADQLLLNVPEPLFPPIYSKDGDSDHGDEGNLKIKCAENYGQRDGEQRGCAQALLSWISSCRYFRKLFSGRFFRCVVLRSRPKSVASVKTVRNTEHWNQIQSFVFAATEHEYEENGEIRKGQFPSPNDDECAASHRDESGKYSLEAEMSELHEILSSLPPNLTSVTLDFPNGWRYEWGVDIAEQTMFYEDIRGEKGLRYCGQLRTAIDAVSLNNIRLKPMFELKLLSVPTLYCAAYEIEAFHQFLSHVTSFTLALCHWDNGAGWNMNVYGGGDGDAAKLGERLSQFFLNHLRSVETLCIYADESWPLGDGAVERNTVEVDLPEATCMPRLKHVSFKQFFVCSQLEEFLLRYLDNLQSISLINCFASGEDLEAEPNWESFIASVANAHPRNLWQLEINNEGKTPEDLFGGRSDAPLDKQDDDEEAVATRNVWNILDEQKAEIQALCKSEMDLAHVRRRQRQSLAHVTVDDKYGMIFDSEESNVSVFLEGATHKQWLRVVNIMEANRKLI